jgi:hypothetical protein
MRLGEVIRLDRPDLDTAEAVVNRRLVQERLLIYCNKETGAVPAPGKVDEETRARAVRLYTDRLRDHGESKLAARRRVGQLLEVKPATLRNWTEPEQRASAPAGPATDDSDTSLKCGDCVRITPSYVGRRWLPPARILHPYPETRFDVRIRGRSPVR